MKKWFALILMSVCLALQYANVLASDGAVSLLESIANRMISNLEKNQASLKTNPGLVYSLAYKIIVPYADLNEMSKRVLPPATWNAASSSQREEFKKQFTRLLVRTYAHALADYKDQTVKFYPVRGGEGGSTVLVDSDIIRSDGPSVRVSYRLIRNGGGWRLYDMIVEGVSLLESFRSQFADKLGQGNISVLINELKQHNARRS